jgi:hypothetical protein
MIEQEGAVDHDLESHGRCEGPLASTFSISTSPCPSGARDWNTVIPRRGAAMLSPNLGIPRCGCSPMRDDRATHADHGRIQRWYYGQTRTLTVPAEGWLHGIPDQTSVSQHLPPAPERKATSNSRELRPVEGSRRVTCGTPAFPGIVGGSRRRLLWYLEAGAHRERTAAARPLDPKPETTVI